MSTEPKTKAAPAGREPIKNKRYEVLKDTEYTDQDRFALSEKQKRYLSENGLVHRFIYEKDYLRNNNFHKSGWKIVADPDMPGSNSDGLVRVGDSILAVKTKEAQSKHRTALRERAQRYSDPLAFQKAKAKELRETMEKSGIKGRIHEGYEDNDGKEKDDD